MCLLIGRRGIGTVRRPALDQSHQNKDQDGERGQTAHETSLMEVTVPGGGDAVAGLLVSCSVARGGSGHDAHHAEHVGRVQPKSEVATTASLASKICTVLPLATA